MTDFYERPELNVFEDYYSLNMRKIINSFSEILNDIKSTYLSNSKKLELNFAINDLFKNNNIPIQIDVWTKDDEITIVPIETYGYSPYNIETKQLFLQIISGTYEFPDSLKDKLAKACIKYKGKKYTKNNIDSFINEVLKILYSFNKIKLLLNVSQKDGKINEIGVITGTYPTDYIIDKVIWYYIVRETAPYIFLNYVPFSKFLDY